MTLKKLSMMINTFEINFCSNKWLRLSSIKQKFISVQFILFDNLFKVALVYACLLLWNTNVVSWISIKNFITYPKHSQIHFLTDTLISMLKATPPEIFSPNVVLEWTTSLWILSYARSFLRRKCIGFLNFFCSKAHT